MVLDGIKDPGNLGTLIRTADWFGISTIICSQDTVNAYNEKVVQASMGSIIRVDIQYRDLNEYLRETKLPVYGTLLNGNNIYNESLIKDANYILGNEGNGIRPNTANYITNAITIPGTGGAESLNVAIAGAIVMSEIFKAN